MSAAPGASSSSWGRRRSDRTWKKDSAGSTSTPSRWKMPAPKPRTAYTAPSTRSSSSIAKSSPIASRWFSSTRSWGSSAPKGAIRMATEAEVTLKERRRIMAPPSTRTSPIARDSRWLALVVLCAGMLMIVLDATIVNVALPSIQSDLGFSQSSLAWVVNAYLIPFGGVLLLAGRLGDLLGRRRVFLAGIAVFTAASLLCGLSVNQEMLVAARFIQGVGGAMTSAVLLGMVVTMFREPREQARAIGIYSFVAAAGASIGLLAGGFLTDALNWHWIFLVNVPIGIATALLALRLLQADRGIGLGMGADALGAFLVTAALLLGVYTIIRTSDFGWGSAHTVGFGAAAIASLTAFVVRESRTANPLIQIRIFGSRHTSGANVVLLLIFAALFGM